MNSLSVELEIFSGTGGVGKTTLAAARALAVSSNKRTLLITIDPAKRLKQVLNLSSTPGTIQQVHSSTFIPQSTSSFDALLLDPMSTFKRLNSTLQPNYILSTLLGPYGSLNEIMAIIELNEHINSGNYDLIILDTPPGKNFIDFLKVTKKLERFFNPLFINTISKLRQQGEKKPPRFLKQLLQTGIDKLLNYLTKVTGEEFINNLLKALDEVYQLTPKFTESIKLHNTLTNSQYVKWFIVTSTDQSKIKEAIALIKHGKASLPPDVTLLVNKYLNIEPTNSISPEQQEVIDVLITRQQLLFEQLKSYFSTIQPFPEVLCSNPKEHIKELALCWQKI